MTNQEFERRCLRITGERVELPDIPFNPRYMEKLDNPTPNGGDYSIAYYYNDNGPCEKDKATRMNIVEYKKGGIRINEHYG